LKINKLILIDNCPVIMIRR